MRATFLATTALTAAMSLALLAQGPPAGGGGQGRAGGAGRGPQTPPLIMTSTAWEDGGVIPDKYTQAAGPTAPSPALSWSQVPPGTQSFAIIMNDPEPMIPAKSSKGDVTHWLIWNIPGTSTGLAEGVAQGDLPDGSKQQSLRGQGYMGPGAPPGPYHHYTFTLYALDTKVDITPAQNAFDTRQALLAAMDGHVLGKAVLVARFHRQ
jgi:Raf kinase inhibitor-like YbhB/YbcL family protein